MILPPSKPSSLPSKDTDDDVKRTPIISIVPLEKDNTQESAEDASKILKKPESKDSNSQEQQDNLSTSSVEDNSSTEPKAAVVELSRVPLTLEIISLLRPDTDEKAGQKPTSFFPGQSGEALYKSKLLGHIGEHEQQGSSEETSSSLPTLESGDKGDSDDQNIPPMPLSYMIPPRKDAEVFWREYPHDSTTENSGNVDREDYGYSSSVSTDSEAPMLTTRAPQAHIFMDPILEKLESSQKAKRQSIEESENDGGEQVEMTTVGTEGIQETTPFQEEATTPESMENESLYQVTTPPSQANEDLAWNNQAALPTPGQPELIDYQPETQPLPFRRDSPSLMDQLYSDYRQQPSQFPSMSMMSPGPVIFPSQKPRRPLYIQSDSYWPQKYFDGYGDGNMNNVDYPFIRYNDNYRSRSNIMIPPSSPVLNTIHDERPIRIGYDDDDEFALGNYRSPNYYSYFPTPTSYVMNRRSNIRYQPFYSSSAPAPVMDDYMYAPQYPHQVRRFRSQPQYYY